MNYLRSKISEFFLFLRTKIFWAKIFEIILLIWTAFIFLTYCYYHQYLALVIIIIGVLAALWLGLKIFYGFKNKLTLDIFANISYSLLKTKNAVIHLTQLILAVPLVMIILANCLLLKNLLLTTDLSWLHLPLYEATLILKILSTYVFWLLFLFIFSALGSKLLSFFKFYPDNTFEYFIFSLGIGLIPTTFLIFIIALLGGLYSPIILALLFILIIFSRSEIKKLAIQISNIKLQLNFETGWQCFKNLMFISLLILLIFNWLGNFKPTPLDIDSLHSYFNTPNLLVSYHYYKPLLHYSHSNMGQNTEMIYSAILAISNASFLSHFSMIFFILCLLGFYFLLNKIFGGKHAILGIICLYAIPWNFAYIFQNKVEIFLAFYSLLILYTFFLWQNNKNQPIYLYLLGIFSGFSLGIKYNAALFIIPLYTLILWQLAFAKLENKKNLIKQFLISSALLIILVSPWLIKNQVYFKNFLYPFCSAYSNTVLNHLQGGIDDYFKSQRAKEISAIRFSLAPQRFTIITLFTLIFNQSTGKDMETVINVNFGFIPLLILPFYLLIIKRNRTAKNLFLLTLGYFILWYFIGSQRPWYGFWGFWLAYALLPLLLIRYKKVLLIYAIYLACILVLMPITESINPDISTTNNLNYLFGKYTDKQFLQNHHYYQATQIINHFQLNPSDKILLTNDLKSAFIEKNDQLLIIDPYLASTGYLLNKSEEAFYQALKLSSVKYIFDSYLLKNSETERLFNDFNNIDVYMQNYQLSIPSIYEDQIRLKNFLHNYTTKIYSDDLNYYSIYKIK